ncbi:stellacyanin-like [Phoenix dactylifera]|uniref:Stellacyanin-like n=1 Tax=Phoenix dactylifera TaxID=42345 RepID=A0A8B9AEZ2_PHODC|nr:stellacyanin-like [Phoenix dactylifera]
MANRLWYSWALQLLVVMVVSQGHSGCWCYQYKVGDLNSWGVPLPSNTHVYALWSQKYHFRLGDSLLFLYPPSQDSVIQVTERAYNSCSLVDPIKKMNDGNSVFNLTAPGIYYFISGVPGHCQKLQKLAIAVPSANGTFFPPAEDAPPPGKSSALPATSPSYPSSSAPPHRRDRGRCLSGLPRPLDGLSVWFSCASCERKTGI